MQRIAMHTYILQLVGHFQITWHEDSQITFELGGKIEV